MSSLVMLAPWAIFLGIAISVISLLEAFQTAKTWKERTPKIATAVFAITLLFVQAASNKRSSDDEQIRLKNALDAQKQQLTETLTTAFEVGTAQIVKLSGQEADNTRKAAKQQTNAIESQANWHQDKLEDASLGSDLCPTILADLTQNQGPFALSALNADKHANIYDLTLYVQEGEHTGDGKGFRTLQQKTFRFPTIPANSEGSQPFEFISQKNTSYLQFDLSTRRKICSGQIVLHGDGHGYWSVQLYPVHVGPLSFHNTEVPKEDQPWAR